MVYMIGNRTLWHSILFVIIILVIKQIGLSLRGCPILLKESLGTQCFWVTDVNQKWAVFLFNLSSYEHIYILKYPFTSGEG